MTKVIRVATFNANGIRSAYKKGFFQWFLEQNIDVLCVQELKAQEKDIDFLQDTLRDYQGFYQCAQKKGYSGVGIWTRIQPKNVQIGFDAEFDIEGRYVDVDLGFMKIASCYFPSGTSGDERQEAKYRFLKKIKAHMDALRETSIPTLLCGDINIAHQELDIKNWKGNLKHTGFLPEERQWVTDLLASGWVDVFRNLYPTKEQYTWWSQRGQARAKNVGWRIDYEFGTPSIAKLAQSAYVYSEEKFSDHAPLVVEYHIDEVSH